MPYQVHFQMPDGRALISEAFARFHDAQSHAVQKAREVRPALVAIREADTAAPSGHGTDAPGSAEKRSAR